MNDSSTHDQNFASDLILKNIALNQKEYRLSLADLSMIRFIEWDEKYSKQTGKPHGIRITQAVNSPQNGTSQYSQRTYGSTV